MSCLHSVIDLSERSAEVYMVYLPKKDEEVDHYFFRGEGDVGQFSEA